MKNLSLTILLVFVPFFLQADNWELFPLNQKTYYYFQDYEGETISTYFMDYEEETEEGILQFPLRTYIKTLLPVCYPPVNDFGIGAWDYENSLLSDVFLKNTSNNDNAYAYIHNYFINPYTNNPPIKDTILFLQHTSVGESWEIHAKAFNESNFPYSHFKISCIAVSFEEIIEDTFDSLKTFQIQAFEEGNQIESPFDDIQIKLSKNYGLIEWIPFHGFFTSWFTPIKLAGFEDSDGNVKGERPPLASDFFPYQVGDFLKWKYVKQGSNNIIEIREDEIIEVINSDSISSYRFNRTTYQVITDYNNIDTLEVSTFETDSLQTGFHIPQNFIDYAYWDFGVILDYYTEEGDYLEATYKYTYLKRYPSDDMCSSNYGLVIGDTPCFIYGSNNNCGADCPMLDPPYFNQFKNHHYSTTLGLTNTLANFYTWGPPTDIYLIEANIGDCYFTNIKEESYFATQITLYPNPTTNRFVLQLQNPKQILQNQNLQLKITDIHGRTLQQMPLSQSSIEVDLSEYSNGIYLVQISDGKSWWTEKVVKY